MDCTDCQRAALIEDELRADYEALDRASKWQQRRILSLERQLAEERESGPKAKDTRELFTYWQERCGHPNTKLGEKRMTAIQSALGQFTVAEIRQAIDGAAAMPFQVNAERRPEGTKKQRYDDIELICRNEVNVERFMAIGEQSKFGSLTCLECDAPVMRVFLSFCRAHLKQTEATREAA